MLIAKYYIPDTNSYIAEYWNGDKALDVALKHDNYPLKFTNLLECYENACLQHPDCVGVSFEYHGYSFGSFTIVRMNRDFIWKQFPSLCCSS